MDNDGGMCCVGCGAGVVGIKNARLYVRNNRTCADRRKPDARYTEKWRIYACMRTSEAYYLQLLWGI